MIRAIVSVCAMTFIVSCDTSRIPGLWREYRHPAYKFSLRVPRTWETKRDDLSGADVVFIASEDDPLFRASLNILVRPRVSKATVGTVADQAVAQLAFLFNEYRLLSRAPAKLGLLPAIDLRSRYRAVEGYRILRTVVALTDDFEYVVTFSCREEREPAFERTLEQMLHTFDAKQNLSRG